jgi:hypothetical protein
MDGKQRLLLGLMLLFSSALVFLFLADGLVAAVILGLVLLAALWITKAIWSPTENSRTKVATASLALIGSIAAGYFKLSLHTKQDIVESMSQFPGIPAREFDSGVAGLLVFALLAIGVVNYFNRSSPTTGGGDRSQTRDYAKDRFPIDWRDFVEPWPPNLTTSIRRRIGARSGSFRSRRR